MLSLVVTDHTSSPSVLWSELRLVPSSIRETGPFIASLCVDPESKDQTVFERREREREFTQFSLSLTSRMRGHLWHWNHQDSVEALIATLETLKFTSSEEEEESLFLCHFHPFAFFLVFTWSQASLMKKRGRKKRLKQGLLRQVNGKRKEKHADRERERERDGHMANSAVSHNFVCSVIQLPFLAFQS